MDHGQWAQMLHWAAIAAKGVALIGIGVCLNAVFRD